MVTDAFTLIEALVALLIFSILASMAIPPWLYFQKNQQANLVMYSLEAAIHTTQTLAITSHQTLSLCPSVDQVHCQTRWHSTLLIFINRLHGEQPVKPTDILERIPLTLKNDTLSLRHFRQSPLLSFDSKGLLLHDNGTFRYCSADFDARFTRALAINTVGRTRFLTQRNSLGQLLDSEGAPISCDEEYAQRI